MPWLGSVKQTWNTLSLPAVTSTAEAEGVIMKVRSLLQTSATAMEAPVVVGPTRTCMPQSISWL